MSDHTTESAEQLRDMVSDRYGAIAQSVLDSADEVSCCAPQVSCCGDGVEATAAGQIASMLYDSTEGVPKAAVAASLGCGNPTALIDLHEGETVLDLGSGGGIDVILSAKRVGPTGKAYGLDMTDEMLELARANQREAGATNVEFIKGTIEHIPLPDESVDVIISNCVINLSADKSEVFAEAQRVLNPGGRFAVSDIVIRGALDEQVLNDVEAWLGCVAGALEENEYRRGLEAAGFTDVEIVPTKIYTADDAKLFLDGTEMNPESVKTAEGHVMSAFVRATKPSAV